MVRYDQRKDITAQEATKDLALVGAKTKLRSGISAAETTADLPTSVPASGAIDARGHEYVDFAVYFTAGAAVSVDVQIYEWLDDTNKWNEKGKFTIADTSTQKSFTVRGGAYLYPLVVGISGTPTVDIYAQPFKR